MTKKCILLVNILNNRYYDTSSFFVAAVQYPYGYNEVDIDGTALCGVPKNGTAVRYEEEIDSACAEDKVSWMVSTNVKNANQCRIHVHEKRSSVRWVGMS